MRPFRGWLGFFGLLTVVAGCGNDLTATMSVDMSACFVANGRRSNGLGRGVDKDGAAPFDGICVAGLPTTPQTLCMAVRVGSKDLQTGQLTYMFPADGTAVRATGKMPDLPELSSSGEDVRMRPFFLKGGETVCTPFKVDTQCTDQPSCLLSLAEVKEKVSGDKPFKLAYGYGAGTQLTSCGVTCNYALPDPPPPGQPPPPCWSTLAAMQEQCDGVDNDCNGHTDEIGGTFAFGLDKLPGSKLYSVPGQPEDPSSTPVAVAVGSACWGVGGCGIDEAGQQVPHLPKPGEAGTGTVTCVAKPSEHDGAYTCCSADPDCPARGDPGKSSAELCDGQGVDENCNGQADEGFVSETDFSGQPRNPRAHLGDVCGKGACVGGTMVCDPNDPTKICCSTEPGCTSEDGAATEEKCNELDDNCDGQTDEDFDGPGGTDGQVFVQDGQKLHKKDDCLGFGGCYNGTVVCRWDHAATCCSSHPHCTAETSTGLHPQEVCDGADNDCNGLIDEGYTVLDDGTVGVHAYKDAAGTAYKIGDACHSLTNACIGQVKCGASGQYACCNAVPNPVAQPCPEQMGGTETCNEVDDDCDGQTDETWPAKGTSCGVGACVGGTQKCKADGQGLCCDSQPNNTLTGCIDGALRQEKCNCDGTGAACVNVDDDCDGVPDEDEYSLHEPDGVRILSLGDTCWGLGICNLPGTVECGCPADAELGCDGEQTLRCSVRPGGSASPAHDEYCNNQDDNCNGLSDEDETQVIEGQVVPLFYWEDPATPAHTKIGLGQPCGGPGAVNGRCPVGTVVCACPAGTPGCAAAQRIPVCSTMPGGPNSPALNHENCNGIDDDCDGVLPADESDPDGDQVLTCNETHCAYCVDADCAQIAIYTPELAGHNPAVAPDKKTETCDNLDNECNGVVDDPWVLDKGLACGLGQCSGGKNVCKPDGTGVCCSTMPSCLSAAGASTAEACDGVDNACSGHLPNIESDVHADDRDADGDKVPECGEVGCFGKTSFEANHLAAVHPAWHLHNDPNLAVLVAAAAEVCDGYDDNCDGVLPDTELDRDEDGVIGCREVEQNCRPQDEPDGKLKGDGTWDKEWGQRVKPGPGPELYCDGRDNDCDGSVDEDFDLMNDPLHCGLCTVVCALPNTMPATSDPVTTGNRCVLGGCALRTDAPDAGCINHFWNLDGQDADGCEYSCHGTPFIDDPPSPLATATEVDTNCDGIDGDLSKAIFVAPPPLGDDAHGGGRTTPVATLPHALALAAGGNKQILVAAGTYTLTAPLVISTGVGIYGGYCPACGKTAQQKMIDGTNRTVVEAPLGWKRGPVGGEDPAPYLTTVAYAPTQALQQAPGFMNYAVSVKDLAGTEVTLDRLTITGFNAPATASGTGASSVVLYLTNSWNVILRDSTVAAGTGATGQDGYTPGGAAGVVGNLGQDGESAAVYPGGGGCPGAAGVPKAGLGGTSVCSGTVGSGGPGGQGGIGGELQFVRNGDPGTVGYAGGGGAAGGAPGTTPDQDPAAHGSDGTAGGAGTDAPHHTSTVGVLSSNYVVPADGSDGLPGYCGGGGGGGMGGRGGLDATTCQTYGGGGGGGGSGGSGGLKGTPGKGGGASIGVLLVNSAQVKLNGTVNVQTAQAGSGGTCGPGGTGGNGGNAGAGGAVPAGFQRTYAGGAGGKGGSGGRGGYGAAGNGGPSIGIYGGCATCLVSKDGPQNKTFAIGNAGSGGACGAVPNSAGLSGNAGQCFTFSGSVVGNCP